MRSPAEWTEEDLLALIREQVTESLTLDYKASASLQRTDARKAELGKDVSAFANSAGGLLIYGIEENGHVPTALDQGCDPNEISKEWIEQVINSRVSRRIGGVVIRQIALSGSRNGRVAYVIDIPASNRAPHMASDHRFYKRFNFESAPMEEYEVRDVSRRLVSPDVRLGLAVSMAKGSSNIALLEAYVENHSPAFAGYALITFHLPTGNFPTVQGIEKGAETLITLASHSVPVHSYKLEWRGSARLPLMQGARYHVAQITMSLADTARPASVFWEVFAPESEPRKGAYLIEKLEDDIRVSSLSDEWQLPEPIRWRV